jgi:hypothetical protein
MSTQRANNRRAIPPRQLATSGRSRITVANWASRAVACVLWVIMNAKMRCIRQSVSPLAPNRFLSCFHLWTLTHPHYTPFAWILKFDHRVEPGAENPWLYLKIVSDV